MTMLMCQLRGASVTAYTGLSVYGGCASPIECVVPARWQALIKLDKKTEGGRRGKKEDHSEL